MSVYLIAYDIIAAKNRTAMARKLEKIGKRIQKSVFIVQMTHEKAKNLEQELQQILQVDDLLLILPLCENCYAKAMLFGPRPPAMFFA